MRDKNMIVGWMVKGKFICAEDIDHIPKGMGWVLRPASECSSHKHHQATSSKARRKAG